MILKSLAASTDEIFDTALKHLDALSQGFDDKVDDKFSDTITDLEQLRNKRWTPLRELIMASSGATDDMTTPAFFLKHGVSDCCDAFMLKDKRAPLILKFEREYIDGVERVVSTLRELMTQAETLDLTISDELAKEYGVIIAQHLDELVHEAIIDVRTYVSEYMTDGTGEIEYLAQEGVSAQDALNVVKLGWNKIFPRYTIPVSSESDHLPALLDKHWDIIVGEIEHMFSLPIMRSADEHVINVARTRCFKDQPDVDLERVLYPMVSRGVLDTMKI